LKSHQASQLATAGTWGINTTISKWFHAGIKTFTAFSNQGEINL